MRLSALTNTLRGTPHIFMALPMNLLAAAACPTVDPFLLRNCF